MSTGEKFERAANIMARLRAPGGCPWDREQTFDSIKPYTLEETYEVFEAIENRDWQELPGELGDLLLQVLFYSEMAREAGYFSIDDVLDRLSSKLVDRHPHVFGDVKAETAKEVVRNWEALKKAEKAAKTTEESEHRPLLSSVSRSMPALLEAGKIGRKAASVGFDWPDISGIFEKLQEEIVELKQNLDDIPQPLRPGGGAAGSHPKATRFLSCLLVAAGTGLVYWKGISLPPRQGPNETLGAAPVTVSPSPPGRVEALKTTQSAQRTS